MLLNLHTGQVLLLQNKEAPTRTLIENLGNMESSRVLIGKSIVLGFQFIHPN